MLRCIINQELNKDSSMFMLTHNMQTDRNLPNSEAKFICNLGKGIEPNVIHFVS